MGFFSSIGFGNGVSSRFSFSDPAGGNVTLFRPVTPSGMSVEFWAGNAAPHDDVQNLFIGAGHLGLPDNHINGAPDYVSLQNNMSFSTNDVPLPQAGSAPDQTQLRAYIYIPLDNTQLNDNGRRTGERIRIFTASEGSVPFQTHLNNVDTSPGGNRGAGIFATLSRGWHLLLVQMSDLSQRSDFNLQIDSGGNNDFVDYAGPVYPQYPTFEFAVEPEGYELQAGEILVESPGTSALEQLPCCPPLSL